MTCQPEFWDLADRQGLPTGGIHRRGDADWTLGTFHVVGTVCCVRTDGRLLVTQRAATKKPTGTWELPGGSALAGETSRIAAARELREETGLSIPEDLLRFVARFTEERALFDLFLAAIPASDAPILRLDPAEVSDAAWLDVPGVERLRSRGGFAGPWEARLDDLWPKLLVSLRALDRTGDQPLSDLTPRRPDADCAV